MGLDLGKDLAGGSRMMRNSGGGSREGMSCDLRARNQAGTGAGPNQWGGRQIVPELLGTRTDTKATHRSRVAQAGTVHRHNAVTYTLVSRHAKPRRLSITHMDSYKFTDTQQAANHWISELERTL